MGRKRKEHPSRYDVSGNVEAQYVDEAQTILVNRRGIADLHELEVAEEECLAAAYEQLLSEVRVDTPMTAELLKHIHGAIFSPLYDWAGRWRTVQISKAGTIWPPPIYLDRSMMEFEQKVLSAYPATELVSDEVFCRAAGHIQGEFLAIHPFREGNARTIKLMSNLLAVQAGRPLLVYDKSKVGAEAYVEAAKAAMAGDYGPMSDIIRSALERARSSS